MWFVSLGVVLLLMKLGGIWVVQDWPWWGVLAPFGMAIAWWTFADSTGYYQRKAMEKMDNKRAARRLKSLDALGLDPKKKKRL